MGKPRQFLPNANHGRSCYNSGCDCAVGRQANSDYLKAYRARKRAEALAAEGVELPDEPEAPAVPPLPDDDTQRATVPEVGPVEKALLEDLDRNDGEATHVQEIARSVARSLDGAAARMRYDLVSPLAQRMLEVSARLFPPAPTGDGEESEEDKALRLLEDMANGGAK